MCAVEMRGVMLSLLYVNAAVFDMRQLGAWMPPAVHVVNINRGARRVAQQLGASTVLHHHRDARRIAGDAAARGGCARLVMRPATGGAARPPFSSRAIAAASRRIRADTE